MKVIKNMIEISSHWTHLSKSKNTNNYLKNESSLGGKHASKHCGALVARERMKENTQNCSQKALQHVRFLDYLQYRMWHFAITVRKNSYAVEMVTNN